MKLVVDEVRANRARRRLRILGGVFLAFSLLSAAAVAEFGYFGVWKEGFRNVATLQILVDLSIGMVQAFLSRPFTRVCKIAFAGVSPTDIETRSHVPA